MSRPGGTPQKGSFVQTLLLAMTIWLAVSLLTNRGGGAPDTRTAAQVYARMLEMNASLMDVSIATEASIYKTKISDAAAAKKLTKDQVRLEELKASILVADTEYKSALFRNDTRRLNLAFMGLQRQETMYRASPLWNQPVQVAPPRNPEIRAKFPYTEVVPSAHLATISTVLQKRHKTELIWGFFPGYAFVDMLVALTGRVPAFSYGFAALLLAVLVRAVIWPLSQRQMLWSRQMSQLQPLAKELKEKYTDQAQLQAKTMELYKEYGINPLAGCFPSLLQLPLFLIVYQSMLQYQLEFKKGTFLWINPGLATQTQGLTAATLSDRDVPLLILYGISMLVTTLLAPVTDPANARQQRMLGIGMAVVFTALMFTGLYPVPAAFVLYWIFTNVLTSIQSIRVYRMPMQPLRKVNGPHGSVLPKNGQTNGAMSKQVFERTGTPKVQKPKTRKRK